ncbi:hypothetical protein TSOC_007245 [Tetrabaena socialis]|uniref:Solute-binding protein family 3/N-terminal domain-containing protein n=1 Tax=Tetrabaena socialis TaxID=47790 RepID=A0A2J8A1H2_9CHLO|nr:hypothetical protein TSOC_007245 [Tetrabaena socialis]|eukprot:PNH06371.1 hypothetical protein TSOC_007245 [Tetrabaena socialis]
MPPKKGSPKKITKKAPPSTLQPVVTERIHVSRLLHLDAPELELHVGRGRLRIAVYAEFFPVAYRDNGAYKGLDIDLIEGFCRSAGLKPQYVRVKDWFDAWEKPSKWGERVDLAIGGIGRAAHRTSSSIEWTLPYFTVRRTIVYNLKNPIRRFPEDVTGVVVGTMGSTGMNDAIERLRQKFGDAAWDHLDARWKSPDAKDIRDLLDGKIQGLMRGSFVGRAIVTQHPKQLGMAEPWDAAPKSLGPYGNEVFAFPCRRGSGLAAQLNAYLLRASHNGDLARLVRKHNM